MLTCQGLSAQTNRALVVAIDNYPQDSGWSPIHGTNDGRIVSEMLKEHNFPSRNIKYLKNQQATKSAIVGALQGLASSSVKGDYLYIHFSTHGQLMVDNNGDEPDGLDEAVIPYDAQRRYKKGVYQGENHLRDDDLGVLLDEIRARIGASGSLTVVLDACHSGTANRDGNGEDFVRGTTYVFAPEGYTGATIDPSKVVLSSSFGENLSAMTLFFACQPEQINYEYRDGAGEYYGALSYAFCSLMRGQVQAVTNKDMFGELSKKINTMFVGKRWRQTPYFESTDESKIFKISK